VETAIVRWPKPVAAAGFASFARKRLQALLSSAGKLLNNEYLRAYRFVAVPAMALAFWRQCRVRPIKSLFLLCTAVTPNFCIGRPVVLRDCCPHMSTSAPSHNQLDSKAEAWSALFSEPMSDLVKRYTSSVFFDKRMWQADIQGSLAHAEMLAAQGIIAPTTSPPSRRAWRRSRPRSRPAPSNGSWTWKTCT
jgi:hypothetical protein